MLSKPSQPSQPSQPSESALSPSLSITLAGSPRQIKAELATAAVLMVLVVGWLVWRGASPSTRVSSEKPGWRLVFADEFEGTALDAGKWLDSYPGGVRTHSNNEQQYYAPEGVTLSGGVLRLTAEKRPQGGMPYTSGMVCSQGRFAQQYGWFEIRARFPRGRGMWPAFWLLPDSERWPPEIDVLEILGHEPDMVLLSHHWGTNSRDHRWQTHRWQGPDFSRDFHTFAVEWKPGEIIWYVDGEERHRSGEQVPGEPMYVLANLAVGGDLPGMPDTETPFPGVMEVDYIRVYTPD